MIKKCTTCGSDAVKKFTEFPCPGCAKNKIVRCDKCRNLTADYKCPSCGFTGP